jgi:hypothetical protein
VNPLRYPTIMSGVVVRWTFPKPTSYDAEVNASRDGVSIQGCWPIMKGKAVADLVTILGTAICVHERLAAGDPCEEIPSPPPFGEDDD